MPTIKFLKTNLPALQAKKGDNLMAILNQHEVPVASSCKGDGVCGRCRLKVIEGQQNLSEQNAREKVLRNTHNVGAKERISCQTQILGDVTLDAPYW
jgi:2Fe-2S ferredoxin